MSNLDGCAEKSAKAVVKVATKSCTLFCLSFHAREHIADTTALLTQKNNHNDCDYQDNNENKIEPVLHLCQTVTLFEFTQLCLLLECLVTYLHLRQSRLILGGRLLFHRIVKQVDVTLRFDRIAQGRISMGKSLVHTDVMLRILVVGLQSLMPPLDSLRPLVTLQAQRCLLGIGIAYVGWCIGNLGQTQGLGKIMLRHGEIGKTQLIDAREEHIAVKNTLQAITLDSILSRLSGKKAIPLSLSEYVI